MSSIYHKYLRENNDTQFELVNDDIFDIDKYKLSISEIIPNELILSLDKKYKKQRTYIFRDKNFDENIVLIERNKKVTINSNSQNVIDSFIVFLNQLGEK